MEEMISTLITAIKKNTNGTSRCIEVFEELLRELPERESRIIIVDMNKFIEEFVLLTNEIKGMTSKKFISRVLTYETLNTKGLFKRTSRMVEISYGIKEAIIYANEGKEFRRITLSNRGNALREIKKRRLDSLLSRIKDQDGAYEVCRKIALTWEIIPAVIKAIIWTKRRACGIDNNSTKY